MMKITLHSFYARLFRRCVCCTLVGRLGDALKVRMQHHGWMDRRIEGQASGVAMVHSDATKVDAMVGVGGDSWYGAHHCRNIG